LLSDISIPSQITSPNAPGFASCSLSIRSRMPGAAHEWYPRTVRSASRIGLPSNAVLRWRWNHPAANDATRSRAPGSIKRCVASGTISNRASQLIFASALRLRANTSWSLPPTMRRVGALAIGEQGNIESELRGHGIDLFLLQREQVEQQSRDSSVPQPLSHIGVAGTQSSAAASVREEYDPWCVARNPEQPLKRRRSYCD